MFYRIATLVFAIVSCAMMIAFARGYRYDFSRQTITPTGLVAVTSSPRSAKVFVDNELKGITDLSMNLPPGEYTFTVAKEGYFPWQKRILLKGEIVQSLDAVLYPVTSSLNPLTNIGIAKAVPIGTQSEKMILFSSTAPASMTPHSSVPTENSSTTNGPGIYLYDSSRRVVSLLPNLQKLTGYDVFGPGLEPESLDVSISPDGKQAVVFLKSSTQAHKAKPTSFVHYNEYYPPYETPLQFEKAYLLDIDGAGNPSPLPITDTVSVLIETWTQQKAKQLTSLTDTFEAQLGNFVKEKTRLLDISADKKKILYQATSSATLTAILPSPLIGSNQTPETRTVIPGAIYVYDTKEDRNYQVATPEHAQKRSRTIFHPNSRNIVFNDGRSINIADFDGQNNQKVYSGPFANSFFATSSDGRILILTNLNPENTSYGDLYAVGIL